MAFDATVVRSQLGVHGPAVPSTFEIAFTTLPNCLGDEFNSIKEKLKFRIKACDLPSRQVETMERRYHGPQRLIPYGHIYSTQNIEVFENKKVETRKFFDAWQEAINGGDTFKPLYYDDVVCEMRLTVYDKNGDIQRVYIFEEVFPVSINPSQLDWEAENTILTIPVELAYWRWISTDTI